LTGKYGNATVFNDTVEEEAINQIVELMNQPMSKDAHVRIMPDVHAGAGCVIGYTAKLTDYVVPNLIGVDIGCGVSAFRLEKGLEFSQDDLKEIDKNARIFIPSGYEVHDLSDTDIADVFEKSKEKDFYHRVKQVAVTTNQDANRVLKSLGTLGGGNHFLEIDKDNYGRYWFLIHSGSRNFGLKIANYHQRIAKEHTYTNEVNKLKEVFSGFELGARIADLEQIQKGLEYLVGDEKKIYIEHMKVATEYAHMNRLIMGNIFFKATGLNPDGYIESIHNYIDFNAGIVRKGAISAQKEEPVIIPLNMRDGSIIGIGKGNEDWNFSAPHGAGRIMSRTNAKKIFKLGDFKKSIEGIYSTSINESTLDESPFAYKNADEIIGYLEPTVEIMLRLKPVWNFKAN